METKIGKKYRDVNQVTHDSEYAYTMTSGQEVYWTFCGENVEGLMEEPDETLVTCIGCLSRME